MSERKPIVKIEKEWDFGHKNVVVKQEPKWGTNSHSAPVDVKPIIKREPVDVKPKLPLTTAQQTPEPTQRPPITKIEKKVVRSEPKTSKTKTSKPTPKKKTKKKTLTKKVTKRKTRTKRKTKAKRKTTATSRDQKALKKSVKDARKRIESRIRIEKKNPSVPHSLPSIYNRSPTTVEDMRLAAGIKPLSLFGEELSFPSDSRVEGTSNSAIHKNKRLSNAKKLFCGTVGPSDVVSNILYKQSLFLTKTGNYLFEKDGRVKYIDDKMCTDDISTDDEASSRVIPLKTVVSKIKTEKSACDTQTRVKEESVKVKSERVAFNGSVIKNEQVEDDVQIIEVEKPEVPLIVLDSDECEKSQEQRFHEKVVNSAKSLLSPFFLNNEITDDELHQIIKKCTEKVCKKGRTEIEMIKLNQFIVGYVKRMKHLRKAEKKRKRTVI